MTSDRYNNNNVHRERERYIYTHDSPARPWDANWQSADVFTRTITHSEGESSSDLLALWFPLTGLNNSWLLLFGTQFHRGMSE